MKYEITCDFRATDKELHVGDIVSKEDLGSSFAIAFQNGWLKAYEPAVAKSVLEEPVKKLLRVKADA